MNTPNHNLDWETGKTALPAAPKSTPGKPICCDCGKAIDAPNSCGTGYAVLPDGKPVCYSCADKRQREELKDRSGPFTAYLSGDGQRITTWTGGELMRITSSRPCKPTRDSFTHDVKSYRSVRARDVHGNDWSGRGSPGILINMRPVKTK